MKRRKIGPGVYVIDAIGTIEMDQWVIDDRKARGLSVPPQRPNTRLETDGAQQKRNMSKWISVIDAMPAEGEHVIGYDKFCDRVGEVVITPWNKNRLHFIDDDDCSITHWQHLPKAPRPTLREPNAAIAQQEPLRDDEFSSWDDDPGYW